MTTNHIELIKEKLSILDVVGSYVKLEQAGKDWKGKSPFTNEKTPSFYVSPDKGFFYCFSSGKGGDVFTFIQEIERVDFKEALGLLAERAGVNLDEVSSIASTDTALYRLLDDACKWYEVNLRKNTKVVDYLLARGLTKETIVKFRIGFAQDSWNDLYNYLKKKNYSDEQIRLSGMGVPKSTRMYDRFRSRVMFPFRDHRGRVVAFSGRIFSDEPNPQEAKYVNSPEGPLFDKSKILYGYDTAKQAIAKQETCVLVEGQFDVIMAQQVGTQHTVAVSGTGLTDDHIRLIERFASTLVLSFDADTAGIKATRRSVGKAIEHGLTVKVITLPTGKDPAEVIKETPSQWAVALADAKDYLSYRLDIFIREHPNSSFEERYKLINEEIFTFVILVRSSMMQDKYLQDIALFLGVTMESVQRDFLGYQDQQVKSESMRETKTNESVSKTSGIVQQPSERQILDNFSEYEEIIGLSLMLQSQDDATWKERLHLFEEQFAQVSNQSLESLLATMTDTTRALAEFKYQSMLGELTGTKIVELWENTVSNIFLRKLRTTADELLARIRFLEHQGDVTGVTKLQQEHLELRKKIDELSLAISQ